MTEETPHAVVEASWEVLNKVGGIHTVVKSKADLMAQRYDDYLMVGPLFQGRQDIAFRETAAPERIRQSLDELRDLGINSVYGQWLIKGEPSVVLLDASAADLDINGVKALLWEKYGVDSLRAGFDFDEPVRWSWAVGMLIERLQARQEKPLVAHFHEWLCGAGLLYLHHNGIRTGRVFTTHATMLGRTICGASDIPLYDELDRLDPLALAERFGVKDKHTMEVACAKHSDVFTTVSEITGMEAEKLLGRKPDVLLFNGTDVAKYPTTEEASLLHRRAREQIRDFLDYYFFSHYTFDLDESLIFFVSGRYEYRNKGLDVLTKSLGRLNEHLKSQGYHKTVVVFFYIPGDAHGIKTELLEERASFEHLHKYIQDHSKQIVRRILRSASSLDGLTMNDLLADDVRAQITRMAHGMDHEGNPPLATHNMPDEDSDAIIAGFRAAGLLNREEDRVKVIRYPIYLSGADGVLDLSYSEAVAGSHLGLFPSYYEPWGYTPVEAAALAIPSLTTDLAGFGRFIQDHAKAGVHVLKRHGRSQDDIIDDLFEFMARFCDLDKYGRMDEKLAAKNLVQLTQWATFIKRYFQAHSIAYGKHS